MNYCWSNFTVEIRNVEPKPDSSFSHFRCVEASGADCIVNVLPVETLPEPVGEMIFRDHRREIFRSGRFENWLFRSILENIPYAYLEESEAGKTLWILESRHEFFREERNIFNCLAMERTMSAKGIMMLHASFIRVGDHAILFTAPSGTGKSTQAALWEKHMGAKVVNGDRAAIWKDGDTWYAGGIPWCGSSQISEKDVVPLKAIVVLQQHPENHVIKLSALEMMQNLLQQTTINPWNRDMIRRTQLLQAELCNEIPVVRLMCRPDEEAVRVLAEALEVNYGKSI